MKILITTLLLFTFSLSMSAQTAVYQCPTTGAIGYCYGVADYYDCAYNTTINYGGINPTLLFSSPYKGYGALAIGYNSAGQKIFGIAAAMSTSQSARSVAINECVRRGAGNITIQDSWIDN